MRKKGAKRCELLNAHKGLGENLCKQFLISFNRLPRSGPQCRAAHTHALTSREYVPRNEPHLLYIVENKEARVKTLLNSTAIFKPLTMNQQVLNITHTLTKQER